MKVVEVINALSKFGGGKDVHLADGVLMCGGHEVIAIDGHAAATPFASDSAAAAASQAADDAGLDLADFCAGIEGSGKDGTVTVADVSAEVTRLVELQAQGAADLEEAAAEQTEA